MFSQALNELKILALRRRTSLSKESNLGVISERIILRLGCESDLHNIIIKL